MAQSLGHQIADTAGIFQGLTALPTMLVMGYSAFWELYYPYMRLYYFITATCTALMSGFIVFILFVQRHPRNTKTTTFYFEIAKSGLATGLWLWLMLDSVFGPTEDRARRPMDMEKKIVEAGLCFLLLPILFYPTLLYAVFEKRKGGEEGREEGEREPLLMGTGA